MICLFSKNTKIWCLYNDYNKGNEELIKWEPLGYIRAWHVVQQNKKIIFWTRKMQVQKKKKKKRREREI